MISKYTAMKKILPILFVALTINMLAQTEASVFPTHISSSESFLVRPLSEIPPITDTEWELLIEEEVMKHRNKSSKIRKYPFKQTALPNGFDPVWQQSAPQVRGVNAPTLVFEGTPSAGWPTDVNGTVGSSHYLQTTNSLFSIYDKSGNKLIGPNNINTIFTNVPGGAFNDGDPIVLYDEQADRYLISEFSVSGSNDFLLVAISQTNDPTGSWYAYSFDVDDMPDYPKFGVWRDGYYVATNKGNTLSTQEDIFVLERDKMLLGQSAQIVGFSNADRPESDFQLASPIDNDGAFAPIGSPGLFITINDDAWNGIKDQLWIYELDVDWITPAGSTFERVQAIDVAAFDSDFGSSRANIAQFGTSNKLDAVSHVMMNRPQYRNFSSHQTIVCCHTVDVNGSDQAGVRWYELRKTSGNWELRQQGTYAPDGYSRWMGSISINDNNRIALGYSISSSTLNPGIRYVSQSPSAYSSSVGNLDVAEEIIYSGLYSQSVTNRWGDYTNICLDPSNDSVFWYTNQYIGSAGERNTKIASFKFEATAINADFIADDESTEINTTVQFTDLSYGSPTSWQWSFNPTTVTYVGGTSSASQNPQVQFLTPGNYNVSLTVTKSGINDTETKASYINVSQACTVITFPWTEGFENLGSIPDCWSQEYVSIENRDWIFGSGNGASNPPSAHGGSYNAYLKDGSYSPGKTKLITPKIDLSSLSTAQMNFWHTQDIYFGAQDELKVYYKTSASGSWNLLADYTNQLSSWQHDSLSLPNLSSDYYIAFEGNAISGNGVCIDDVSIKTGQSCPFPVNLQTENIASASADLCWTEGGSAVEWEIEWGPTGFTQGTGTTIQSVTTNPVSLTGLSSLTDYDWYVRAKCSPLSASRWTGPVSFTTTEQVLSLPVIEDFESGMVKFDNASANNVNWFLETALKHGGNNSVGNTYTSNNTNILVETGVMDLSAANQPSLRFWHICSTEEDYDFGYVEVSTDGGTSYTTLPASSYQGSASGYSTITGFDEASYTEWGGASPDNSWWKEETFSLDNFKSSTVKIRFRLASDISFERSGWYIDDIIIEVPTCPQPSSASTSNITHNSAQLTWVETGSATSWDVEYGSTGFTQGTGTMITGTSSNPYLLSGLTSNTTYDWYIRSSCGAGDNSTWVGPTTFSTTCVATTIPYLEDFESISTPNIPGCMTIANSNNDGEQWKTSDWYSTSGTKSANIYFNVLQASNDWLFTEGIQLTGGVEYECGFGYRAGGWYKTEKLEIKWGTSPVSSAMTGGTIWQNNSISNETFMLASGTFTPSVSGVYYIGIHCSSIANQLGVYIDDIYVHESSNNAIWTGNTDNDWWKASNWGEDTLPGASTNVTLPVGLTNYPTLDHIGPCNEIIISSSSSGEASIIDNKLLLNQSNATVQRYLSGGKWHGISAPINNATVNNMYFNGNPDLWMKSYNEADDTWTQIVSLTTPMPFGAGFIVWVESGNNVTVDFKGELKNNDLYLDGWTTPTIKYTDAAHGFNLIGNPYPSALDWDNPGWDTTGVEGSIWVWSDAANNYLYRNSQGQGSLTNGVIPMSQGFFIRATDENISFSILPSARVHSSQQFYKNYENTTGEPFVVVSSISNGMTDECWVSFNDESTENYDNGKDVSKMFSEYGAPQIYIRNSTDSLSILSVPLIYNDTRVVDMDYIPGNSGIQLMELSHYEMMWDTEIYLEDQFTSKIIDFKTNPDYEFESSLNDDTNRFKLHFVNLYTDVRNLDFEKGILVYSADGSVYISNKNLYNLDIRVVDILGRVVNAANTSQYSERINNLKRGQFYLVHIQSNEISGNYKVFVK